MFQQMRQSVLSFPSSPHHLRYLAELDSVQIDIPLGSVFPSGLPST